MESRFTGAIGGAIGGLAGTLAMNYVQRLWTVASDGQPPGSAAGLHDARDWQERTEGQNSNEIVARGLARMIRHQPTEEQLAITAAAIHFSFGTAVGAIYGAYAAMRENRRRTGVGLGTALWFVADEIAMPVLRLSRSTLKRPLEMHLQSLVAHFIYGIVTERVRRHFQ